MKTVTHRVQSIPRILLAAFALAMAGTVSSSAPAAANNPFGLYRAQTLDMDSLAVDYLGGDWSFRILKPYYSFGWWYDSDPALLSTCGAGVQMVFTLTTATDNTPDAYYPSNMPAWLDSVTNVVERYDGDGYKDMPGLPCPVKYWHVEQEDTFWKGTDSQYLDLLARTRTAILAADPTAKVGLIGLSSDQAWNAAYQAGFVHGKPQSIRYYSTAKLQPWIDRTTRLLAEGSYDFIDLHSYQIEQTLTGTIAYLHSLSANPTVPVWCFEAGGPSLTREEGYTDTLNAYHVMTDYAEALTSGVVGYAFEYLPPGSQNPDMLEKFVNIALTRSDNATYINPKPSYETYRLLTQKVAGFTSATDMSLRDRTDEDSCLFDMRFQTPQGQVDIIWCPLQSRTLSFASTSSSVKITHPITRAGFTAADALVETRPVVGGVVLITAGPEPVFVESSGTTGIAPESSRPGSGRSELSLASASPAKGSALFHGRGLSPGTAVNVVIGDVFGRVVRQLELRADGSSNQGSVLWDLRDLRGRRVPAGLYFATTATGGTPVRIPVLP